MLRFTRLATLSPRALRAAGTSAVARRVLASASTRAFTAGAVRSQELPDLAQANSELLAALRSEQRIEEQTAAEISSEEMERLSEFATQNGFEVVATDGIEEVQLVKKVSASETVRVFFSISDVINSESLLDETEEGSAAEDEVSEDDYDTPIRVNIVVEKPNGALGIEAVVQDELVLVESLTPYASAKLALEESPDADYKRRQTYQGPPYSVLDPSLQSAVLQYLEARGINSEFALFLVEFSSFRENKEYAAWLKKIADFVEN